MLDIAHQTVLVDRYPIWKLHVRNAEAVFLVDHFITNKTGTNIADERIPLGFMDGP